MFICQVCHTVQKAGVKQERVVIEKRYKEYFDKSKQLVGKGWEIVRELVCCWQCKCNVLEAQREEQ